MNSEQIKAELRLFKSYSETKTDKELSNMLDEVTKIDEEALSKCVAVDLFATDKVKNLAVDMYGISAEDWNQTFHKSFKTVIDTPIEDLVVQQLMHYFTTYGLEALGFYKEEYVYIPHEQLDIPELEKDLKLVIIKYITEQELSDKILKLLNSGIALSKQTISDIMLLSDYINKDKFDEINNNEVKIALYDKYDVVPKCNIDFLRYMIFKLTDSTLVINSKEMINILSNCDKVKALELLQNYVKVPYGYRRLAEIYLTYKHLFVAIKSHNPITKSDRELNHIINRIRKQANIYRKQKPVNILDRLTSIYKFDGDLYYYNDKVSMDSDICDLTQSNVSEKDIISLLDDITIFREIRIVNALKYRNSGENTAIIYKIRNGKSYVTSDKFTEGEKKDAQKRLIDLVYKHLIARLKGYLKGKSVYLPENIIYSAPTSEKQFIGNVPVGTTITLPREKDLVIGVHWTNLPNSRVDLDLHAIMDSSQHIGWNGSYKDGYNIVYSGDVTDAVLPKGATECIRVSYNLKKATVALKLKNYTSDTNRTDIPYEFIIATTDEAEIGKNYTINPNNILVLINTLFEYDNAVNTSPDKDIAYIDIDEDKINVVFSAYSSDNSISGFNSDVVDNAMMYMKVYPKYQLTLNKLLEDAGCELSEAPVKDFMEEVKVTNEDGVEEILFRKVTKAVDYDLSIENISKDSILRLFMEDN